MTHPFTPRKLRDMFDRGVQHDQPQPATPRPSGASNAVDPDPLDRFDTGGLQLLEDVVDAQGFDPYGHGRVRSKTARNVRPRTDLRALSAQILAERAQARRRLVTGD
jgi:hypothetical protein